MSPTNSRQPRIFGSSAAWLIVFVLGCTASACKPTTAASAATSNTTATTNTTASSAATPAPGAAKAGADDAAAKKAAAQAEKDKARQAAAEQVPVETAPVVRGPISSFLSFNTTLETESAVDLYPQTSGQIEALLVEEGRVVKEGEPLLKIEDSELKVDADESAITYEHQLQGFARNEDLFKRNLINKQEHDDNRYQLDQARIRNERAKLRLAYATVRAPFDGVITAREAQVGARVGPSTKLFSMVKLDDVVARVFVPGRYLASVAEKQPAVITTEFAPDKSFQGWVKRLSPVIDPKSGTFKVTVGVRSEKLTDLPPGSFVGVRIITDTRPAALLIPKRAIVYEGGERFAFVVAKERAVKRKLTVGYEDPQNVEVLAGFEVGTPVIVLGQSGLKDGSMVRIVNAPPAPEGAPAKPVAKEAVPAKTGD